MVVPEYQDGKSDDPMLTMHNAIKEDTRKAGGQTVVKATPKIIVDMREFRSDLPCLIHKRGIEVVPVTITVESLIFWLLRSERRILISIFFSIFFRRLVTTF